MPCSKRCNSSPALRVPVFRVMNWMFALTWLKRLIVLTEIGLVVSTPREVKCVCVCVRYLEGVRLAESVREEAGDGAKNRGLSIHSILDAAIRSVRNSLAD